MLKRDTLFELASPDADTCLRRVAVGKGRRVLRMDEESTGGVEGALAVVASGVSRAQAVLAADSFVWRAVDDSDSGHMCTQWEEYTTAANTSYVAVANAYATPQPQSVLAVNEGSPATGPSTQVCAASLSLKPAVVAEQRAAMGFRETVRAVPEGRNAISVGLGQGFSERRRPL